MPNDDARAPRGFPALKRRVRLPAFLIGALAALLGAGALLAAPGRIVDQGEGPVATAAASHVGLAPDSEIDDALSLGAVFATPASEVSEPDDSPGPEPTETGSSASTSTATPTLSTTTSATPSGTTTTTVTPTSSPTPTATVDLSPSPTSTATPTLPPTPTSTPASPPTATPTPLPPTATPTPGPPTATPTPAPPPPNQGNIPRPHLGYGTFTSPGSASWTAGMGFGWMVWRVDWGLHEPAKGAYDWWGLDQVLNNAQANGIQVILRVDSTPGWARSSGSYSAPPDNLNDLGDFMAALAQHAGSRASGYVIWNEPNLSGSWGNQGPNPGHYVQMLQAVYGRVKSVAPDAAVVTAGMASTGNGGPGAMGDLDYIHGIYQNGGQPYFDVLGSHPYGFASSPETDPNAAWGLAFRRAEQQRQVMEQYGDGSKQVWAIEFNWILDPGGGCSGWGDWPTRWWQRVDEATQADYLVRAFQYAYNNWPWMGVMTVFNLDFAGDYWRDYCEPVRWYSLLYRVDHTDPANYPLLPRPAYDALAAMAKPGS